MRPPCHLCKMVITNFDVLRRQIVLWAVVAALPIFAYSQDCTQFQIYDTYSSSSDYSSYERVKDVACSDEVKDRNSAFNAGISAGIPIPVLDDVFDLKFGASTSKSDWEHWRKQFCSSHLSEVRTQLKQASLSQIFSNNAKEVIESCLRREPVYAYIELKPPAEAFAIKFNVQGKEKLIGASVKPPDAVNNCNPKNPFDLNPYYQYLGDLDISGLKMEFGCGWNTTKWVHVKLILKNQGSRLVQLPPIVKREAPPEPPPPTDLVEAELTSGDFVPNWLDVQRSGSACGSNTVVFDPASIATRVNSENTVKWDANYICRRQGIKNDVDGKIFWGDGKTYRQLPAERYARGEWGTAKFKYLKSGDYDITIEMTAICQDRNYPDNSCTAKGTLHVHVDQ